MAITIPLIFDKPLTFWLGILLIFTIIATLATGGSAKRGALDIKYHIFAASITLIIGVAHAIFGILTYI